MHKESTSIVIPTHVEQEQEQELLKRICASMEPLDVTFEIIVIHDDTDESGKVEARRQDTFPIRAIPRPQGGGLAKSVLDGITASNYDIIVVMSAELCSPEKIPELVSRVQNGADIAIGRCYTAPDAPENPSFLKQITRKGADLFVRTLFREIRNVADLETGFFALRKDVVTRANLNPVGDNVLLEILVQGNYDSVSEVEYEATGRDASALKEGGKNKTYDLRHLSSLFWRSGEFHRFLKFAAVGAVGAVLNLAVLYVLTELGLFYLLSGLIGIEAGLLSNFFLNRSWTFKDRQTRGVGYVLTAFYRDHVVRFVGIVLNLIILWLLTSLFGVYYLISQVIGIGVAMLWNYGGNQWWTWETA